MSHNDIQARLLLYLDRDLPESKEQQIRDHLSQCALCSRQLKLLAAVWQSEEARERIQPPTHLWAAIERRILRHKKDIAVPDWREIIKRYVVRPAPAFAAIAAVLLGIYIGTFSRNGESLRAQSMGQRFQPGEEFGLNQFDLVPPGSLGITLINVSNIE
jgi:hypothetical protein